MERIKALCFLALVFTSSITNAGWQQNQVPKSMFLIFEQLNDAMSSLDFPKQYRNSIAAQIEQETCPSPTSKKCANPTVELKTHREYGFGLGQITIAYRADGSVRFNVFEELTTRHPELKDWKWEDRYNPYYQIKSMLLLNRTNYTKLKYPFDTEYEKMAAMFAAYNGGFGDIMKSRFVCLRHPTCPSRKWFGGIETMNVKSQVKFIYGRSPREINNEYPHNILKVRMQKYEPYVD